MNAAADEPFLPRLLILDGANIMANFRELVETRRTDFETRSDPMILAILSGTLMNQGWNVRIVLPKLASSDPGATYIHTDILDGLSNCGSLVIRPITSDKEEDDRAMLQIAQRYGALIISQDKFENHFKEFGRLIKTNVISYKNVRNDNFLPEKLKEKLIIERKCCLKAPLSSFYVHPTHPDYAKVKRSHIKFPRLNDNFQEMVASLNLFIHEYMCLVVNQCRPNTIPVDFMQSDPDYVVSSFADFMEKHRDSLSKARGMRR